MPKTPIFVPCYFGSIDQFAVMLQYDQILFEAAAHYQKQSLRNRQEIYGANGKLKLSIPVEHVPGKNNTHQVLKDVKIKNEFKWQKEHFKSIQAAYRTAPFFEFFEDELSPIYQKRYSYLLDFNLACFHTLLNMMNMSISYKMTHEYQLDENDYLFYSYLADAKREAKLEPYYQVFMEKHGFLSNLSVLDLIFNLGNESRAYLSRLSKKLA